MPKKRFISLKGLRTFCFAARHESFRVAAEELFITPSAVSHQIKKLEDQLGQALFDRSGSSLMLTDVGRDLFAQAGPHIEALDAIAARIGQRVRRRPVRISVQPFFASEYFVPRLGEFTAHHPDIDIQVGTSDESADRHPADADLSIRLFRTPPGDLSADLLFPLRLQPAAAPAVKKALKVRGGKMTGALRLIVHETSPKAWEQWSAMSGITLPQGGSSLRFDSMIAAARAAEQGSGAVMMPVPLGEQWFETGRLVPLFEEVLVTDASYYLVCRPDRSGDAAVQALRAWIVDNFTTPR